MHSIRVKILAMATMLLVLFAVATGLSTLLMKGVVGEIAAITEQHFPLSAQLADIDVLTFEYELRLRRAMAQDTVDAGTITALRTGQAEIARTLRERFAAVHQILNAAVDDQRNDVADRIGMARADGSITLLERKLMPFLEVGDQVLAALEAGDIGRARLLMAGFGNFEQAFGRDIAGVRHDLDQLKIASLRETRDNQLDILSFNGGLFAVATVLGLTLFVALTNRLQHAFRQIIAGTNAVENGRLDIALPIRSRDEFGQLARAFNHMVLQLKENERVKDTFGKYLDPRIVTRLVDERGDNETLSERRPATVFFSDIKGFSGIGESLTAGAMVSLLNSYFTAVTREIRSQNGIIDKFIGDGVMAFWTAPFSTGDRHATDACLAALAQQGAIARFRDELPHVLGLRRNVPAFTVRMGIATGEVVIGTIGSDISRSYTVIGDVVNAASRLEGVNKVYGSAIIIDEPTWRLAQQAVEVRELDLLTVAGRVEPLRVYELLAPAGGLSAGMEELVERFAAGLAAYRTQDWGLAAGHFDACLALQPEDGPSLVFRQRIERLRAAPPAADWDGVWRLTEK